MQLNMRNVLGLTAVAAFGLSSAAAYGDTFVSVANGDWHDYPTVWQQNGGTASREPNATDSVTISHHIDVDASNGDQAADNITVSSGGQLDIEAGRTLSIDGSDTNSSSISGTVNVAGSSATLEFITNAQTVTISGTGDLNVSGGGFAEFSGAAHTLDVDGDLNLQGNASVAKFDHSSGTITVTGDGAVFMQDANAEIQITSGSTMQSQTQIEGKGKIVGPGTYANHGFLVANASNGTLELASTLQLSDTGESSPTTEARFAAREQATAKLRFACDASSLLSNIAAVIGVVEMDGIVTTDGALAVYPAGEVTLLQNAELCVDEWVFRGTGEGGSVNANASGAKLYYETFVPRDNGWSGCENPGVADDTCGSWLFAADEFECTEN